MDQNHKNPLRDITENITLVVPIQKVWEAVSSS